MIRFKGFGYPNFFYDKSRAGCVRYPFNWGVPIVNLSLSSPKNELDFESEICVFLISDAPGKLLILVLFTLSFMVRTLKHACFGAAGVLMPQLRPACSAGSASHSLEVPERMILLSYTNCAAWKRELNPIYDVR